MKILKIISVFVVVILIGLVAAAFLLQDKVASIFLKSLNNNISTRIDAGSFHLSFLRKFPAASLELKDVTIHSSADFDHSGFKEVSTDTLLSAKSIFIEFNIGDIINSHYTIRQIDIKSGEIILLSDNSGNVNYDIKIRNSGNTNSHFDINLEKINLKDVSATYSNLAIELLVSGTLDDGLLKSKFSDELIDFKASSTMHISTFFLMNTRISRVIDTKIEVDLSSSGNTTLFRKGVLTIDDNKFGLTGTVTNNGYLDLHLSGQKIDLSGILNYFPDSLKKKLADYNPSGICEINADINGTLSRKYYPHLDVRASMIDGNIKYKNSGIAVRNLSLSGSFSNGKKNVPQTSSVKIDRVSFQLGSSSYTGSFSLNNFINPTVAIGIKGELKPKEIITFLGIENITDCDGSTDLDLKLAGAIDRKEKFTVSDLIKLNPRGSLTVNSMGFKIKNQNVSLRKISGVINISESIDVDDLSLEYNGQPLRIAGTFENLPGWLSGNGDILAATAKIGFDNLDPDMLFTGIKNNEKSQNQIKFPSSVFLNLDLTIKKLVYRKFTGENIKGSLKYKPQELTFNSFYINTLSGVISGNGSIFQNKDRSLITKGNFILRDININTAFSIFNNFGQDFIKAENLAGSLSGSVSMLLPFSSGLKPQTTSLTAEGKYTIKKGVLVNFKPVESLSSYIELSELQNISFENLENDFYIRNNSFYNPQMEVKSTAADLSVSGKHSFENNYEYHVRILLSQVLSKKFRTKKSYKSDFGAIEDDGLGRISVLLKVENEGDDVKVAYDMKAAGNEIKKDFKAEKQSLKTILKEEYGWFKSDTTVQKKEQKKPKFRITWDESGDSVKNRPEIPAGRPAPSKMN